MAKGKRPASKGTERGITNGSLSGKSPTYSFQLVKSHEDKTKTVLFQQQYGRLPV